MIIRIVKLERASFYLSYPNVLSDHEDSPTTLENTTLADYYVRNSCSMVLILQPVETLTIRSHVYVNVVVDDVSVSATANGTTELEEAGGTFHGATFQNSVEQVEPDVVGAKMVASATDQSYDALAAGGIVNSPVTDAVNNSSKANMVRRLARKDFVVMYIALHVTRVTEVAYPLRNIHQERKINIQMDIQIYRYVAGLGILTITAKEHVMNLKHPQQMFADDGKCIETLKFRYKRPLVNGFHLLAALIDLNSLQK